MVPQRLRMMGCNGARHAMPVAAPFLLLLLLRGARMAAEMSYCRDNELPAVLPARGDYDSHCQRP